METQRAFLSAVSAERQKSWHKAEANYEEVLRQIYKTKWRKHFNKEKLRLLVCYTRFLLLNDTVKHSIIITCSYIRKSVARLPLVTKTDRARENRMILNFDSQCPMIVL